MLVQHLRHPLERIDVRPGFWGLEWSCPSPWEVPEGMKEIYVLYIEAVNRGTKYTQKVPTTYIYICIYTIHGWYGGWLKMVSIPMEKKTRHPEEVQSCHPGCL